MSPKQPLSRRDFLKVLGLSTGAVYVAGCAAANPAPTIMPSPTATLQPTAALTPTPAPEAVVFRVCFNVEYRLNPDKDLAHAGMYDPKKGVLGTLLINGDYQHFTFKVADIRAQLDANHLESFGIIPEGATFDVENWWSVGGWPRSVNALWVSDVTIGAVPLLTADAQRAFILRNFASNENVASDRYPFATYASNGVRVPAEGVDGGPCVKYTIAGGAGASWMVFKEAIDLAALPNDATLNLSLKLGRAPYEKWTPPPVVLNNTPTPPPTYEIGPGKQYENISDMPWEGVVAGDVVYIYWRERPYQEKIGIDAQGTADKPILIHGVPGPDGQLPQIDGHHAATRPTLPLYSQKNSLIGLGGYRRPARYVTIENLEILNASKFKMYYPKGKTKLEAYNEFSAGIYIEWGEHITIRNCTIHDCANGIFAASYSNLDRYSGKSPFDSEIQYVSRDLLLESNHFYKNGVPGKMFEHHTYCAAINTLYQFNHYDVLANGSTGYALKDRGAGTVVRYNWIEDGRRQISLDDGQDCPLIPLDPHYDDAYVYGNILIERDGGFRLWGDDEIISFGGDDETVPDRRGTLYFFNNTIVTYRTKATYNRLNQVKWAKGREPRTCLLYLPLHDQTALVTNNIFYAAGDAPLTIINDGGLDQPAGTVELSHNWLSAGWLDQLEGAGVVKDDQTTLNGTNPGFADLAHQDFSLRQDSACLGAGAGLEVPVTLAYRLHQQGAAKDQSAPNIGAY